MGKKRHAVRTTIVVALVLVFFFAMCAWFVYYWYQSRNTHILDPQQYNVVLETRDIKQVSYIWLNGYLSQYNQRYAPLECRLKDWEIGDVSVVLESENTFTVTVPVLITPLGQTTWFNDWGERDKGNSLYCNWMLEMTLREGSLGVDVSCDGLSVIAYPPEEEAAEQNLYRVMNDVVFVSYDHGQNWALVPVSLPKLYQGTEEYYIYNGLDRNEQQIDPALTWFAYGGAPDVPLCFLYSTDAGVTWNKSVVQQSVDVPLRLRLGSFPTMDTGYLIVAGGREMSYEVQMIYKTEDGGASWVHTGGGPETRILWDAGFVDENVGFFSYFPQNFQNAQEEIAYWTEPCFYRTADGGATFEPVAFPPPPLPPGVDADFWNAVFVQPYIPYWDAEVLTLLVGQGEQGDYEGGQICARYVSQDMGESWDYVDMVLPEDALPA